MAKSGAFYSRDEVAKHNKDGDLWLVIGEGVYDVSKWISKHPGGYKAIKVLAGKDSTEAFRTFHNQKIARTMLPAFKIGQLKELENGGIIAKSDISKDYEILRQSFQEKGVFKPAYAFYFRHGLLIAFLFAIMLSLVVHSNGLLTAVAAGFFLGMFWQQLAFVGHDIGHHSISQKTSTDDLVGGMVGNLLTGISIGWWKDSHNFHHIVTNSYNYDPDIQHLPVFAVSKRFFKSFFSEYHQKEFTFDSVSKFFVSHQHILFYPVMAVARLNLYLQSFIFVLTSHRVDRRLSELVLLSVFWLWLLSVCSLFQTWPETIAFFSVAHITAGLIHIQICLSHFSMPTFDDLPQDSHDSDGYVISQFEATTNIKCSPMMDFFHGGLQFQTEHHLFPRASRSQLRGMQPSVKAFCKKNGIPYHEMGFFEANMAVLKTMRDTAKEAKCFSSFFVEGLNAVG